MASSYTGLGTELMTTGENAGTWGTTTNTNLQIIEQLSGGYTAQSIAGSAQTTTLSVSDGSTGATLAHRVIEFTGTITGNQIVTIPLDVQQLYVVKNGTSGAYTVQFKYVSGSGSSVTFAATDKGTKILYAAADHASNPNIVDSGLGSTGAYDLDGNELTLDADSDTSITASTDDQIDIEIAGADDFTFTANAFNVLTGSHATFADSANAKFGTGNDMLMYHDGSNSYITNAVGALKIATETSGIALTIGHTTSETTIADNLTTTGDTSVGGTLGVTGVATFATHVALGDSDILKLGAAPDMQLYHDGSNSYITNATGALKIATETSGIAVTIGHTTSEVTVADNLTVTGTLTLGSGAELTEAELEFLDGITAGTAAASKAMVADSNIDITGGRNITISGELDAATLDISGNADIDGTMEADAYTIGGASFIKVEGTNFTDSLLVGHSTTGTLDNALKNTGVGIDCLDALTTADETTAVGYLAGGKVTTSSYSTFIGTNAGFSVLTGNSNTAIGRSADYYNDSGTNNVSLGTGALTGVSGNNHSNNTAIGMNSLSGITTGGGNVGLGYSAGDNITSGSGNVVIGNADVSSATGSDQLSISSADDGSVVWMTGDSSANITFAAEVAAASLDISGNVDIDGTLETDAITLGGASFIKVEGTNFTDGLIVGHATTGTLDNALRNTVVGIDAGDALTTADDNTVVGYRAGTAITTGGHNTLIGKNAGATDSTGYGNTGVGKDTLYTGDSNYNTAVGYLASYYTTGTLNVAIGAGAGQGSTSASSSYNTFLGKDAGNAITTGGYNIAIGYDGGDNLTTGSGNILIGTADVASATGDHQLKIAGYNGSSTVNWMTGDSSGNVTFPAEIDGATLDISGNADIDGTTNLDAVDIDGAVQIDGAVTVGVDDTGLDVKLFGAAAGAYGLYDQSENAFEVRGATAAGAGLLKLTTGELTVVDADKLGRIDFQAPLESDGTDAVAIAASIWAEADDTFSSSVNNTDLVFALGKSEAAAEKFRLTADGEIGLGGANYGTDGQVLTSAGAGAAAAWEDVSGGVSFKQEGTDFSGSLLLGHSTTGTLSSASNNVGVGKYVLDAVTSGNHNTAIGERAMSDLTTGTNNVAVGHNSVRATVGVHNNTGIGTSSLNDATGGDNTALGANAGDKISSGTHNISIGSNSAGNLTSGSGNILIGSTLDAAAVDSARTLKITSYDGSSTTNHIISDSSGNVTLSGDLTVSGDDITMGTNTSGAALIADGTNFNPVVISGDISIGTDGAASIAANSVDGTHIALGSDAQGDIMYYNGTNYVRLAPGTDGQFLKTQGSSANPAWADSSGIGMGKAIAAALVFG